MPAAAKSQDAKKNGYAPLTGYTGHVQTDPTGLIYMRGRFYAPIWHRFVNSDQGADPSTFNQMSYVGGSPMMGTDPSGMMAETCTTIFFHMETKWCSGGTCTWVVGPEMSQTYCFGSGGSGGTGSSGSEGNGGGSPDLSKKYSRNMLCPEVAEWLSEQLRDNFSRFGNVVANFGPMGSATGYATFSSNGPLGVGSQLNISSAVMMGGDTVNSWNVGVTITQADKYALTFSTNPGHVLYPASISFHVANMGNSMVDFEINVRGDFSSLANHVLYDMGGGEFEDDIWNHLLDQAQTVCSEGK